MTKREPNTITNDANRGDRSPNQNSQAPASDRQSDNDSNASSSGMAIKKQTKNVAQKTTKRLRTHEQKFNHEDPNLLKWFEKAFPEKRLRKVQELRSFLEKRY